VTPRAARWAVALAATLLGACTSLPERRPAPPPAPVPAPAPPRPAGVPPPPRDLASIPDAVPRVEPRSRSGNPASYVVFGQRYHVQSSAAGHVERGTASWYGPGFHAARTSSGEPYDMYAMTAAHKTLPIPAYARVTNLRNGRSVVVRINDRGPFVGNRIIDLSYTAAWKLDMLRTGTAPVEVRVLSPGADVPGVLQAGGPTGATPAAAPAAPPAPVPPASVPALTPATPAGLASTTPPPGAPTLAVAPAGLPPLAANRGSAAAIAAGTGPAAGTRAGTMLQAGAFFSAANAQGLVARLAGAGIGNAVVRPTRAGARTVWQVRVGPLASGPEVDDMLERLRLAGVPNARLALD
jgi:rare lipoprotein A